MGDGHLDRQPFHRVGFALIEDEIAERIKDVLAAIDLGRLDPVRMPADDDIGTVVDRRPGKIDLRLVRPACVLDPGVHRGDDELTSLVTQPLNGVSHQLDVLDTRDKRVSPRAVVVV